MAHSRRKPTRKKAPPKRGPAAAPVWVKAFLAAFRLTGNVRLAADAAKIDRSTAYDRRDADPAFRAAWDAAREDAADLLEEEARRRAYEGWEEPVFGSGGTGVGTVEVGTVRKYSDTLLIFLLNGARPEKYRSRHQHEHTGPKGGPIPVNLTGLSDDQLAALDQLLAAAEAGPDPGPGPGGDRPAAGG